MGVPFKKMQLAVRNERRELLIRDMLSQFAKALNKRSVSRVMRDFDDAYASRPEDSPANVFMSCHPQMPNADLYIVDQPVSMLKLLKGDLFKNKTITNILMNFAKSNKNNMGAIVLFRVKHLGTYVAYNIADPAYVPIPRLVLPSSELHQSAISIMPITTYAEMCSRAKGSEE